jgi:hypothetical protein
MTDDPMFLDIDQAHIAGLCAVEGIPVAAIGRILQQPFSLVHDTLKDLRARGVITLIPRSDWNPSVHTEDRNQSFNTRMSDEDLLFACQKEFRLTKLKAGFFSMLLRHPHVTKSQLHSVIEGQRTQRGVQPDDTTDPKMVDVVICNLRKDLKKVDPDVVIMTVWGQGYYIEQKVREHVLEKVSTSTVSSQSRPSAVPHS